MVISIMQKIGIVEFPWKQKKVRHVLQEDNRWVAVEGTSWEGEVCGEGVGDQVRQSEGRDVESEAGGGRSCGTLHRRTTTPRHCHSASQPGSTAFIISFCLHVFILWVSHFLTHFLAERDAKRKSKRSYNNLLRMRTACATVPHVASTVVVRWQLRGMLGSPRVRKWDTDSTCLGIIILAISI